MILFALGMTTLVSLALSEQCPHPEDMVACTCKHQGSDSEILVNCKGAAYADVDKSMNQLRGKKVREIKLENVKFGRVPSIFFWDIHVHTLRFEHCELREFADGPGKPAFVGLEDSLQELWIQYSVVSPIQMSPVNMGHLRKLSKFLLIGNNIKEINRDWFKRGPSTIRELHISNNNVENIQYKALSPLVSLEKLVITGNKFRNIRRDILPTPAIALHTINLGGNKLSSIPEDMFTGMPSLKWIGIHNNLIQRLPSGTYSEIWQQIDHFRADTNPLECDEHIDWMLKVKRPKEVLGVCALPPSRKGFNLKDLIDKSKS